MSQHDMILDDALGNVFRADLNAALLALFSTNSGNSRPTAAVQGTLWLKTVSGTLLELYLFDGTQDLLIGHIDAATHKFHDADGLRRAWGGTAGGTADALTITTTPAITAYENGQLFVFYTGGSPNGGAMTLNVDGVGTAPLKINGADPAAADVPANSMLMVSIRTSGGNVGHIIGGALPRATTARYGNVLLDNEAGLIAGTVGKVPTSDVVKKHARERLYANRTYYVRTDGSDSNTGLVNNAGGAWLTLQKAWDVIHQTLDLNGYTVTVQIGDGTYSSAGVNAYGPVLGGKGTGSVVFQGNSGTPGNVVISVTSDTCFLARDGGMLTVKDMELATTTSGNCLSADGGGAIAFSNVRFGACAGRHIDTRSRGVIYPIGSYAITGGAQRHLFAGIGGMIDFSGTITVTLTGTPAFSQSFARAAGGLIYVPSTAVTFSGAATGTRYTVASNGAIDTEGGGATYLPGNAGGSTAPDDEYS